MIEVVPGIYRLELPISMPDMTLAFINVYIVPGDSGILFVDTGWNTEETLDTLQKNLAEIGATIKDISRIIVTHIHPDHYGLAGRLKEISGAEIAFHHLEEEYIDSRYVHMDPLLEQTARSMIVNGMPPEETTDIRDASLGLEKFVIPTYPDVALKGGETISFGEYSFRVIWTPGHSSGHICLYEPSKKLLIAGDHILPSITPNVSLHPQALENPLGKYIDSLKSIRQLDIDLVLPGHEEPFTNLKKRIDEITGHHEERNRQILMSLDTNSRTAYQVVELLTWGISSRWEKMPAFHKRLAMFETLAHLEMMRGGGTVTSTAINEIIYYRQR